MNSYSASYALHERALRVMPGPNSNLPGYELMDPRYIRRAKGARMWDVDGNEYIDYICGVGAGLLGYGHPQYIERVSKQLSELCFLDACRRSELEVEVAEKLTRYIPSAEKVRFLLSGTDAVQLTIRLARAYTGRNLFIRFDGHYHGWLDNVLGGNPSASLDPPPYGFEREGDIFRTYGRDKDSLEQSFKIEWNNIAFLEQVLERYGDQVALIIMEPVNCNGGVCWPKPGYLERVRELCDQYGILLCFDEVITGFRFGLGGAQEYLGVTPDISTFGKGISSGVASSVVAGKAKIMDLMLERKVVGAGTFNGNPLGLSAIAASLSILEADGGSIYKQLDKVQGKLTQGLKEIAKRHDTPMLLQQCRGCFFFQFTELEAAYNMGEWMKVSDHAKQERFRKTLFDDGILFMFRARWYVSMALTEEDVNITLEKVDRAIKQLKG